MKKIKELKKELKEMTQLRQETGSLMVAQRETIIMYKIKNAKLIIKNKELKRKLNKKS